VEPLVGHLKSILWMGPATRRRKTKDPSRMREVCAPAGAGLEVGPARYRRACR
jgi:hypothetical protein